MSKNIKIRLTALIAILFACATACFSYFFVKANEPTLIGAEFATEYKIGDTLTIPDGKIKVGGEEYDTSSYIILPDGSAKTVKEYTFVSSGIHEVVYFVEISGKTVKKSVESKVINNLYEVPLGESSAKYGSNSYLSEERKGVNLSLKSGETFTFNKLINISEYTKNDKIIEFYVTPDEVGVPEFNEMIVTLTDLYDRNNTVSIRYSCISTEMTWSWCYMYTSAKAGSQKYVGMEYYPNNQEFNFGNKHFVFHTNNKFGFPSRVSYTGELENGRTFEDNYQYASMDYAARKVYVRHAYYNSWGDANMVTDLDEPIIYDNNLWNGFTTGEVLLSVSFNGYLASTANVFITKIADYDLSDLNFDDDVAPIIKVDYDGYEKSLPKCFVDKPYKIFNAKSYDNVLGEVDTNVEVYYNYYSDSRVIVPVTQGAFTPKYEGKYTIVYSATDPNGNKSEQLVDIIAETPADTLKIVLQSHSDSFEFGKTVKVADYKVAAANGRSTVSVCAVFKDDASVKYEIDAETASFNPEYAGEYEIKYTANDYTSAYGTSYTLTVEKPNAPVFTSLPELPEWLIKSSGYSFEECYAYDYSDGTRKSVKAEVFVSEDGKQESKINGVYTVKADKTVKVIYRATGANGEITEIQSKEIKIVNANYGNVGEVDLSGYFQGEGFTAVAGEEYIDYYKSADTANIETLRFIREVYAYDFAFNFAIKGDCKNFKKLNIVLTDKADSKNELKITFVANGGSTIFYVNDYAQKTFTVDSALSDEIALSYSMSKNTIIVNASTSFNLDTVEGLFDGFKDKFVDLKIEFEGVSGKVGISVYKLLLQRFYKGVMDFVAPTIVVDYQDTTIKSLNETLTLKRLRTYDVIDVNVKLTLKVTDSKGNPVTADDGTVLNGIDNDANKDYTITFKSYGKYNVQYNATDFSWNDKAYSFTVTVKDMAAPEVSLSEGYAKTAKVGDEVKVADVNVSDSSEYTVYVMLTDANGEVSEIGKSFKADKAGKYTVAYYVVDAQNNATIVTYEIIVK